MPWDQAQEAVRQVVSICTGAIDFVGGDGGTYKACEWEGRESASEWASDVANVELRLGSVWGLGQDETRSWFDSGTDSVVEVNGGTRRFTVTVVIFVQNQDPSAASVGQLAGQLRTRLRSSRMLKLLNLAQVTMVSIGATQVADFVNMDGRLESRSFTDVEFLTVETFTDPLQDGSYIARVSGQGEVESAVDGSTIVVPFDVVADGVVAGDEPVVTETDEPVVVG